MWKAMKTNPRVYSVLGFLAILYSVGIFWGMPSEFVPEIDSDVPIGVLSFFSHVHDSHEVIKYPAFHKIVLLPLYAGVFGYSMLTGAFHTLSSTWPFGFTDPMFATSLLIVATRILNLIMGIGTLLCLFIILFQESKSVFNSIICFLLFGLSGAFTYYVKAANYDGPQLFWWSLSFVFTWKYLFDRGHNAKNLWRSALFIGIATATKDQSFVFALSSGLTILCLGSVDAHRSRLKDASIYGGIALLVYILTAIACNPVLWVWHVKYLLSAGGIYDFTIFAEFNNTLRGHVNLFYRFVKLLTDLCSIPGCLFAIIGMVYLVHNKMLKKCVAIFLPFICFYFIVVYRDRFVYERHVLNIGFLVMVPACLGIRYCKDLLHRYHIRTGAIILGTALSICVISQLIRGFVPVTYAQVFDVKRRLAKQLPNYVPRGSSIEWQGSILELPNSDTYAMYDFMVPDGATKYFQSKRIDHVLNGKNDEPRFVLSSHDLFSKKPFQNLINQWVPADWVDKRNLELLCCIRNPEWVENNIRVYQSAQKARTFLVAHQFYLYKRTPRITSGPTGR